MRACILRMASLPLVASIMAGCAAAPIVSPPQIVTVTHIQYAPLPASDLQPCAYPFGLLETNRALLVAEQTAVRSLQTCNRQLDDLRVLSAKVKP